MSTGKPKAIICTNDACTLYHFRGSLMRALLARGHEVIGADPDLDYNRLIRPWKSRLGIL
jgi:hypothetical protein